MSSCRCSPGRSVRASRVGRSGRRLRSSGSSATLSPAGNGPRKRCARPSRHWRRSSMVELRGSTTPWSCSTGAPSIDVVGDAADLGTISQAALLLREGPRLPAVAHDAGDWLHTAIYVALPGHRVVLYSGTPYDETLVRIVAGRGGQTVVVGSPVVGAALTIAVPADHAGRHARWRTRAFRDRRAARGCALGPGCRNRRSRPGLVAEGRAELADPLDRLGVERVPEGEDDLADPDLPVPVDQGGDLVDGAADREPAIRPVRA